MNGRTIGKTEWRRLLTKERALRKAAYDAAGHDDGESIRRWWKAVADVCFEYTKSVAGGGMPEPPPADLVERLGGLAGYLAVGRIPDPVAHAAKAGRTSAGPAEARDIGMAVAYWRACRPEGIEHRGEIIRIDDPDPVERLHLWFGASKRTIHDWCKTREPAFLGVNHVNAEVMVKCTVQAAERYRLAGRTMNAIGTRDSKRKD